MSYICPICGEPIMNDRFMWSSDRPYYNIYLHRACSMKVDMCSEETINKFQQIFKKGQKIHKKI